MDIFAIRLKELRTEKGYTQKQLAELIGTTDDSVFSWEKGRSQPPIEFIRLLCKALSVSADYLLGLEDDTAFKKKKKRGGGRVGPLRLSVFLLFGLQVLPLLHAVPVDKAV